MRVIMESGREFHKETTHTKGSLMVIGPPERLEQRIESSCNADSLLRHRYQHLGELDEKRRGRRDQGWRNPIGYSGRGRASGTSTSETELTNSRQQQPWSHALPSGGK